MPDFGPAVEAVIPKIAGMWHALVTPELGQVGERSAATVLADAAERGPGVKELAPKTPYLGVPETRAASRTTAAPTSKVGDGIRAAKRFAGALIHPAPDLPRDLQDTLLEGSNAQANAGMRATYDIRNALAPLADDPTRTQHLWDYLKANDITEQGLRDETPTVLGRPLHEWGDTRDRLQSVIDADPKLAQAVENMRQLREDKYQDMVDRGWAKPESELPGYSPRSRIGATAWGFGNHTSAYTDKPLGAQRARGESDLPIEGDLLKVWQRELTHHYTKAAGEEMFSKLANDPSINVSEHFGPGDHIPPGFKEWAPEPGQPGHKVLDKETQAQLDHMGLIGGKTTYRGGHVFPEAVTRALENFKTPPLNGWEKTAAKGVGAFTKGVTTYNPANAVLHLTSDYPMALLGLPGEKSHALGVMRFTPMGYKVADRVMFGGDTHVTIHGPDGRPMTFDAGEAAMRAGFSKSTFQNTVDGHQVDRLIAGHVPAEHLVSSHGLGAGLDLIARKRLAIELGPRIAAGLEALARTGDMKEFGRIGREITLNYGAGAPALAKMPLARLMSPFIQFMGLASKRTLGLVTTKGSRGRTLAMLAAVPTMTMMWNTQNAAYEKVENSLPEFERGGMHIIAPDPHDHSKPLLDETGKPVVLRCRFDVPEDMAKLVGLGNLPSRIRRVVKGVDKPEQLLKDAGGGALEQLADLAVVPGIANQILKGESPSGRKLTGIDRVLPASPALKLARETYIGAVNDGPRGALSRAAEELTGTKFTSVRRKGSAVLDADLMERSRAIKDLTLQYKVLIANHDYARAAEIHSQIQPAVDDLDQLVKARYPKDNARGGEK